MNSYGNYASRLENYYLACSFKSKHISKYGLSNILTKTVADIKDLHAKPLLIRSTEFSGEVKVLLGQITGDNLGLHQLFGFAESFVSNYPCRFCRMSRYQCQKSGVENQHYRRSEESFTADVKVGNLSATGVKSDSILNTINYYHVTENYCPDIMHDILEGVGPLNIKILLNQLLISNTCTMEEINNVISSHNYMHLKNDKPSLMSQKTIQNLESTLLGLSASQTYCLIQNFPFLFGSHFPKENPYWGLFLIFLDLFNIIMSPKIGISTLPYLQKLIEDHHYLYMLLTNQHLKPKHHHLLHYPEAIRQLGPIKGFWTMRFEARHKFFKSVARTGSNFKNLPKSVSNRFQLNLAYKFVQNKALTEWDISSKSFQETTIDTLSDPDLISSVFRENPIHCTNQIVVNGEEIRENSVVMYKNVSEQELPIFVKIITIISNKDSKYYFLSNELDTLEYCHHFHAYSVVESERRLLVSIDELDLVKPLLTKHIESSLFVAYEVVYYPNQLTPSASISSSSSITSETTVRNRKRKLFFDEESSVIDIKLLLQKHDQQTRTSFGQQVIDSCEQRKPLTFTLRCKLVYVACHALMDKTDSEKPSTDQRKNLASIIVDQLFYYMNEKEKNDMKESFFTPSTTFLGPNGKKISKRPVGHIQAFFQNFWSRNKANPKAEMPEFLSNLPPDAESTLTNDDISRMKQWLKQNKGPNQKVFEYLELTFSYRQQHLKSCAEFPDIVIEWPRLFDIDGAISNDFNLSHPIAANLFVEWPRISTHINSYADTTKKKFATIGISEVAAKDNPDEAALFMLAFLIRPKNRKVSQCDAVQNFIKVYPEAANIPGSLESGKLQPQIVVSGRLNDLAFNGFRVLFQGKAVVCSTLLEAVDISFKSHYVFSIEFSSNCFGAYQFLDYAVYRMKQTTTISSSVKELAAFVSSKNVST